MGAESALGLPALAIAVPVRTALHGAPIRGSGPSSRAICVPFYGDDGGGNGELIPAKSVVVLRVVALVGEQLADRLTIRCIANGWSELRRILTGANASVDGQREMAVNVKDGRELGPFPHRVALLTRAPDIVATDVPSL